ncbi:aminotransferase class I/II-fold pyridoxal phosphate-dependent enzyme [Candidatus Izemoplasma sp. B36]|uniref:aminotransferase class I/II-fold pyridoxal phosphate-dependent enzyme n=1 Tax=Candidatus Izemoplasma sp. B36 TaxID=3242468 RepID=UPI00355662A1
MKKNKQSKTPFFTKLKAYGLRNVAPFDVPGHKLGRIPNDLIEYTGKQVYLLDSNSPIGLDHLNKPEGVILESENLMAEACKADKSYFITNGTTIGILAMIMTVCKADDKIILPRNVHKSVINGLILSGAVPIFVKPNIDKNLGIANDMSYESVEEAINEHPDAKAVFIINPTYFGVISDIVKITELAHKHDMVVVVDEAHGAQFYFSDKLPISAMEAGCDLTAISMHKTAGSFTQSSAILCKGDRVDHKRLRASLNMLQSTSPSSLLLASLDVARKTMYFEGQKRIDNLLKMASRTRQKLREIPGIQVIDKAYFIDKGSFNFDETKIIIKVSDLGLSGFDAYKLIMKKSNIQLELAESHIVLAVLTIGTTKNHLDRLVNGFRRLSSEYYKIKDKLPKIEFSYQFPETYARPRDAYHAPKLIVTLDEAVNEIAGEQVMIYPPGIPILIPGEIITEEVINDIKFYSQKGSALQSDLDDNYIRIVDTENWKKWEGEKDEI